MAKYFSPGAGSPNWPMNSRKRKWWANVLKKLQASGKQQFYWQILAQSICVITPIPCNE